MQFCIVLLSLTTFGMHVVKKNYSVVAMYGLQSSAIVGLLLISFHEQRSLSLLLVALVTLVVKVIMAPTFFSRLLKRHKLKFAVSTYASTPLTLIIITGIIMLANSAIFAPLITVAPAAHSHIILSISMMLISIFLMVNRKGALSQVIGVLSLENSIVAFAIFAGLEQSAVLQVGILFDIFVWSNIAIVLVSMVYRHVGSLDTTSMRELQD